MSKHTPGPWRYAAEAHRVKPRSFVWATGGEIVRALSTCGNRRLSRAEREANARLIAAAPELLEALVELHEVVFRNSIGDKRTADAYNNATKAIAKATGGAQ